MKRVISVAGQCMQTDYVYNDLDQMLKETHIDPGVCFWFNNKPVYAYASNGIVTHYRFYGSTENISPLKAYMLGIPSVWSQYLFRAVFLLLPIILMLPVFENIYLRLRKRQIQNYLNKSSLFKRILCVSLCYTIFFSSIGIEHIAQAAINYSSLSRSNWGAVNTDIHYRYDDNGSLKEKITSNKDEADPDNNFIEKTIYEYNLQNHLSLVKKTTDGTNWDITTYKYNDDGIRVEKNDNGTITTYLVDSYNHTGYAQVLEEWDTTSTPSLLRTYFIGDDVIGQADNTGAVTYLLYDGQGSVRHHSDSSGNLVSYNGCDTFAYDAYGHRVDPLKDVVNDGLFYTGERFDAESSLYYLRARYYNPLNGLFNQVDPYRGNLQDPQSLHKYLYCHNNPVNGIDPSGQFTLTGLMISTSIGAIIGAIAGGVYAHCTQQNIWKGILIGAGLGALAGATIYLLWSFIGAIKSGALQRFFWDPRTFSTISKEYWQQFGPSAGRSLHHWLIPQRWTWIPQGIRNAGFNLLELPKVLSGPLGLNQWMGFAIRWGSSRMIAAMLIESGIRILIPVTSYVAYHTGKWLGNELKEETIELAGGVQATPLKLTPSEEEQMQEDTGNALQAELK